MAHLEVDITYQDDAGPAGAVAEAEFPHSVVTCFKKNRVLDA